MSKIVNGIRNYLLGKMGECETSFFPFASSLRDDDDFIIPVSQSLRVMEQAEHAILASAKASIFSSYIAYYDRRINQGDSETGILDGIRSNALQRMAGSCYDAGNTRRDRVAEIIEDGKRRAWAEIAEAAYHASVMAHVKEGMPNE